MVGGRLRFRFRLVCFGDVGVFVSIGFFIGWFCVVNVCW